MKFKRFTLCFVGFFILFFSLASLGIPQVDQAKEHFDKGFSYLQSNDFEKAAQEFQKAIELDPANKLYYSALGDAYIGMKRYKDAIKVLEKCSELDESWNWPIFRIGLCYYNMGKNDEALFYFDVAQDLGYEKTREYIDEIERKSEKVDKVVKAEAKETPPRSSRRSRKKYRTGDVSRSNFCKVAEVTLGAGALYILAGELFLGSGTEDSDLTGLWTMTIIDNQSDQYGNVDTWMFYGDVKYSDSKFSGWLSSGSPGLLDTTLSFSGTAADDQINIALHVQASMYSDYDGSYTYYYTYDFTIRLNKDRKSYYTGTTDLTKTLHPNIGSTTTWNFTGFATYLSIAPHP